jgi:CCR4-NOT transcription complex subunit 3
MFADSGHIKSEEQQNLAEDVGMESAATAGPNKHTNEDDTKIPFPVWSKLILIKSSWQKHILFVMSLIFQYIHLVWFSQNPSASTAESTQLSRDTDLSPGQPLQHGMTSSGVGVICWRSVSDLGAIGDNLAGTAVSSNHDHIYNLQMLEAAFHKLPQPKDSERAKNYVPVWSFIGFCY